MKIVKSKLIQDEVYPGMYRIKWPDGEVSDMVNKTRAKEYIRCYEETEARIERGRPGVGPTEPADAFNGGESYPSTSR